MKTQLVQILTKILKELGVKDVTPQVDFPADLSHGDYTTNIAMVLAKMLKRSPIEIAEEIVTKVKSQKSKVKSEERDHFTEQSDQKTSGFGGENSVLQDIEKIEVVPPGFINFHLAASALSRQLHKVLEDKEGFGTKRLSVVSDKLLVEKNPCQRIMVEFAHPNTHKAFHIGHLRNISTGESIVRLLESQGHEVIRVNYQGDVGMHIAKCLFGILHNNSSLPSLTKGGRIPSLSKKGLGGVIETLKNKSVHEKVDYLGKMYAAGSQAFEESEEALDTIKDINYLIYAAVQRFNKERGLEPSSTDYMKFVHGRGVEVDEVYELWKETRQWSLDYFENIYRRVGSHYDRYYFESECLSGVDDAKDAVKKGVLEESEGAIIFNGKKYSLDTRVFVNSLGLPTYEAKELALAAKEFSEFGKIDKLIHVVGPEQASFFQVTFKVEELLGLQKDQQLHLVYGWVKLKHGKMSSRSGNVVLGEWLLDEAKKEIYKILEKSAVISRQTSDNNSPLPSLTKGGSIPPLAKRGLGGVIDTSTDEIAEKAAIAAVKYSFLKVGTKQEISFDLNESVNFEGDSGPYLQYTYARAKSVLRKAKQLSVVSYKLSVDDINQEEALVLRLIYKFPEIVQTAAQNYSPNVLCEYLYDLASSFNTFYNKHSILWGDRDDQGDKGNLKEITDFRLSLTAVTAQVLKNGLQLLGIETLEKM